MAKKYDDFDEADQDGVFDQIFGIISNRRKEFAIVSVAAAVLVLGLIVWDSYPSDSGDAASESVPIVRSDAGDYKTTPDNPGGMEIPYRDSTVFSSDETPKEGGPENILADESTEEPLPRAQLFAGLNTEEGASATAGDATADETVTADAAPTTADQPRGEVEDVEAFAKVDPVEPPSNDTLVKEAIGVPAEETDAAPTKTAAATIPEAVKSATKDEEPAKSEPVEEAKAEPKDDAKATAKVEPAAGTTAAKVSPGGYYVQLASVRSASGAAGEFKKLQAKYSVLSGVDYRTQEANLGAKGTFYRIQAGPMSKDSASSICNSIKSSGGSCLVTGK